MYWSSSLCWMLCLQNLWVWCLNLEYIWISSTILFIEDTERLLTEHPMTSKNCTIDFPFNECLWLRTFSFSNEGFCLMPCALVGELLILCKWLEWLDCRNYSSIYNSNVMFGCYFQIEMFLFKFEILTKMPKRQRTIRDMFLREREKEMDVFEALVLPPSSQPPSQQHVHRVQLA